MILFFDTETTGIPDDWNAQITDFENWPRMVQVAYILCDYDEKVFKKGDYLIKPNGFVIPKEATAIHGITTEKALDEGVEIETVLEELKSVIGRADYLVAHNITYDKNILGAEFLRNGIQNILEDKEVICTMESATNFCAIPGPYGFKWPTLSEMHLILFETTFEEAHNASVDISITAKCFWELAGLSIIDINEHINKKRNHSIKIHAPDLPELIPYRKGDKWGFCDREKNIKIECKYDGVGFFNEGFAHFEIDEKFGYINTNGETLVDNKYMEACDFSEGLARVRYSKWGIINKNGEQVVRYIYDKIDPFVNNLSKVQLNNKVGFINKNGDLIIPFIYDDARIFEKGFAPVLLNGKWGIVNNLGIVVIPCKYKNVQSFYEGMALVQLENKVGFYNEIGIFKIPFIDEVKYGASSFHNGLAKLTFENKTCFIDKNGVEVVSLICDYSSLFCENLLLIRIGSKFGYMNKLGDMIIPTIFDRAFDFYDGLALVCREGKYGYINKKGGLIIPFIFENASMFKDELACVCFNKKFGYIDKNGIQKIPFLYDEAEDFSLGFAKVGINNKFGFIDKEGNQIISCMYENRFTGFIPDFSKSFEVVYFFNSLVHYSVVNTVTKAKTEGYIDELGIEYWED